ncbi:MAG: DUF58 domain-containing protein, partial [Mariprofundaceae bacterium]
RLHIPITPSWQFGMTRPGVLLMGVLSGLWLAAFYSGNNLLYLCGSMLTALALASVWQAVRLLRVAPRLAAFFPDSTQAGESYILRRQLNCLLPYVGFIDLEWTFGSQVVALQMRVDELTTLSGRLKAEKRGVFRLKRQQLMTAAPLGLWKIRYLRDDPVDWIVLPRPCPWSPGMFGADNQSQPYEGDELRDLRGYVPGDAMSRIHWRKAATDMTRWSVKRFEQFEPATDVMKLRVDLRLPESMNREIFEESFENLLGQVWSWVDGHDQKGEKSLQIVLGQQMFDLSHPEQRGMFIRALAEAAPQTSPPSGQGGLLLSLVDAS